MLLGIQYHNYQYDCVDTHTLERLIAGNMIRSFYRASEERWVNVYHDPVRGIGGDYSGSDRRQSNKPPRKRRASTKDKTI